MSINEGDIVNDRRKSHRRIAINLFGDYTFIIYTNMRRIRKSVNKYVSRFVLVTSFPRIVLSRFL